MRRHSLEEKDDEQTSKHRASKSKGQDHLAIMMFGADIRSLACMRIGLGIIILLDLYVRSWYMHDHYSKWAVFPAAQAMESPFAISLYFINSTIYFQWVLFGINALAAIAFIVGFHTQLATCICWLMMVSLHTRNIFVLNAGDDMIRLFMFWCMFLPLGRCISIDSIHNAKHSTQSTYYVGIPTIATMIQFCIVYWFTAWLKDSKEWNADYTATYYALHLDQFVTRWGIILRGYPTIMKLLTAAVINWEKIGPLLFFVPFHRFHGPLRTFAVLGFICLHLGFGMCLELGFFMYIPGVCVMLFVPSWFWDNLISWLRTPKRLSITIYYGTAIPSVHKTLLLFRTFFLLHETPILPATSEEGEDLSDVHSLSRLFSVVDKSTGEILYGHSAIVRLYANSPLLFLFVPILKQRVFARLYDFIATKLGEDILHIMNFITPDKPHLEPRKYIRICKDILALFFIIYILIWNFASVYKQPLPGEIRWIGPTLKLDQWWGMFAPRPPNMDGWIVIPGKLKDGTEVDVFQGGKPVSYDKPEMVSAMYPTQRWRKFMMNLQRESNKDKRLHYGRYLCREWNFWDRHPPTKHLESFKIIFMMEKTEEPGTPTTNIIPAEIWNHEC